MSKTGAHARLAAVLIGAGCFLSFTTSEGFAQVGDVSDVNYPEWIPSDQVEPKIRTVVSYDSADQAWQYDYSVFNGPDSRQAIEEFDLRFTGAVLEVLAPTGWIGGAVPPNYPIPGAMYFARPPDQLGAVPLPAPVQISPGDSLAGFASMAPYPPGYARAYVRGFAAVPFISEEDVTGPIRVPHDTTNSQRRWTVGPTRYTQVLTSGDGAEPTDGFLGFMSVRTTGSVLLDPAPIALELGLNGESVVPETLLVTLNGVDVTDRFHPGPEDGADLVALFRLGSSPLQEGTNLLITNIQGLVPGTQQTGTDTDAVEFSVDSAAERPSEVPF